MLKIVIRVIVMYNFNIIFVCNYCNSIEITICNVGSHSEHTTDVLHYISLLLVLYKRSDDGWVN
jgi:hypothetical protein